MPRLYKGSDSKKIDRIISDIKTSPEVRAIITTLFAGGNPMIPADLAGPVKESLYDVAKGMTQAGLAESPGLALEAMPELNIGYDMRGINEIADRDFDEWKRSHPNEAKLSWYESLSPSKVRDARKKDKAYREEKKDSARNYSNHRFQGEDSIANADQAHGQPTPTPAPEPKKKQPKQSDRTPSSRGGERDSLLRQRKSKPEAKPARSGGEEAPLINRGRTRRSTTTPSSSDVAKVSALIAVWMSLLATAGATSTPPPPDLIIGCFPKKKGESDRDYANRLVDDGYAGPEGLTDQGKQECEKNSKKRPESSAGSGPKANLSTLPDDTKGVDQVLPLVKQLDDEESENVKAQLHKQLTDIFDGELPENMSDEEKVLVDDFFSGLVSQIDKAADEQAKKDLYKALSDLMDDPQGSLDDIKQQAQQPQQSTQPQATPTPVQQVQPNAQAQTAPIIQQVQTQATPTPVQQQQQAQQQQAQQQQAQQAQQDDRKRTTLATDPRVINLTLPAVETRAPDTRYGATEQTYQETTEPSLRPEFLVGGEEFLEQTREDIMLEAIEWNKYENGEQFNDTADNPLYIGNLEADAIRYRKSEVIQYQQYWRDEVLAFGEDLPPEYETTLIGENPYVSDMLSGPVDYGQNYDQDLKNSRSKLNVVHFDTLYLDDIDDKQPSKGVYRTGITDRNFMVGFHDVVIEPDFIGSVFDGYSMEVVNNELQMVEQQLYESEA